MLPGISVRICHLISPMDRCFAMVVSCQITVTVVPVFGVRVEARKTCFLPLLLG